MTDHPRPQHSDENPIQEYERKQRAADEIHDFAAEPRDLFADAVTFHEDHNVLRIAFYCSRPDSGTKAGAPMVPAARISLPIGVFRWRLKEWLTAHEPDGGGAL